MESSQLYAATLTHFSTEPLTTGPDYDPLLLLLALASDVHQDLQRTHARSASQTSLAKAPATCVQHVRIGYIQDVRIGYIQDVLVFETLRIIVKPMAGSVWCHHSHMRLHHRLVPPTRQPCQTRRSTYYSGMPMVSAINRRN